MPSDYDSRTQGLNCDEGFWLLFFSHLTDELMEYDFAVQMESLHAGISVIVPVYKSTHTLPLLVTGVHSALSDMPHEIILVDDGSPESTWMVVRSIASDDDRVIGVRLGRNVGQHSALLAGVRLASHQIVVTLDDDLQNPPDEIQNILKVLSDDIDVVYGTPTDIAQTAWRRVFSWLSRELLSSSFGADSASNMSSFRAFRTSLRTGFDAHVGPSVSLDSLLAWSTSRFASVKVSHDRRRAGISNYSVRKLLQFAVDTVTGYSIVPLRLATLCGFTTILFGVGVLCWVCGRQIFSETSPTGFPFLVALITIFAGTQLLTLGIIGEYLGRMHFRIMHKPTYVIAEIISLGKAKTS